MADKISKTRRSANMAAIRSKDTSPELIVRRLVHSLGYRYRLHRHDLPGKPDLVFGPRRKIIFVHGCFWHMHPKANCLDARLPKSNTGYWAAEARPQCRARRGQHPQTPCARLGRADCLGLRNQKCRAASRPAAHVSAIDNQPRRPVTDPHQSACTLFVQLRDGCHDNPRRVY